MKAHNIIKSILALSLAVASVTSCQEKMKGFGFTKGEAVKFSVGSAGSSLDTKAAYSGVEANSKERIDWQEGDLIRIYCDAVDEPSTKWADYAVTSVVKPASGATSTAHIEGTGGVGLRWGTGSHTFYAAYPSPASGGIATDITGNTVTGNLTSGDQGNKGKTETSSGSGSYVVEPDLKNMLMTAKAGPYTEEGGIPTGQDNVFLEFKPLTTAIEFTIYNGNKNAALDVKKIMLISKNTQISGSFTVDLDTMEGGYAKCTGTAPDSKQVCIDFSSLGISLAEATGDGLEDCKSLKFTFFLAPTTDISDLTFKIYKSETAWMSTKLGYTDGSGVKFPRCKKTFVTGLLVPEGAQWTVKYGPDVDPWLADDSDIDPKPEVSGNPIVTSWNTGIEAPLDLEVSKPDLLPGKFSVSATEYVQFSRGNLQATYHTATSSYTWDFATNQYDIIGNAAGNTTITNDGKNDDGAVVDLFGWSTDATNYGINKSKESNIYYGDFKDWGIAIDNSGTSWRTLPGNGGEWDYLLKSRTNAAQKWGLATLNSVKGLVILPDDWSLPGGCTFTAGKSSGYNTNKYASDAWVKMEQAGAVFLSAAGIRAGQEISYLNNGYYWSSTANGSNSAYRINFSDNGFEVSYQNRHHGHSVRLVQKFFKPHDAAKIGDLYWATTNIGADTPKDYGWYFSWGGTTGYVHEGSTWVNAITGAADYTFSWAAYNATEASTLSSDIIPTSGFDAARVNWGGDWRMPTAAESQALYNSTYWNWDNTDMGYYVYLPKNENDKGHFNGEQGFTPQGSYSKEEAILFFPGTCYGDGSSTGGTQEDGLYWLSTYWGIGEGNFKHAYYFNFHEASYILPQNNTIVMAGFPIRPVHD